jgi:hypothetical protein
MLSLERTDGQQAYIVLKQQENLTTLAAINANNLKLQSLSKNQNNQIKTEGKI